MNSRPLLLLDVDGALSPLPNRDAHHSGRAELYPQIPAGVELLTISPLHGDIVVDARLAGWLAALTRVYDLVWATTWDDGHGRHARRQRLLACRE